MAAGEVETSVLLFEGLFPLVFVVDGLFFVVLLFAGDGIVVVFEAVDLFR